MWLPRKNMCSNFFCLIIISGYFGTELGAVSIKISAYLSIYCFCCTVFLATEITGKGNIKGNRNIVSINFFFSVFQR